MCPTSLTIDLNIDSLLAARVKIDGMLEAQGVKVSVNDLVIKAAAVALKQVPEANASYSHEGIAMHHHADIAMAVAIDGGLITPIIRSAELEEGLTRSRRPRIWRHGPVEEAQARGVPKAAHLHLQPWHVRYQGLRLDHQ